jgi:NTE family protein
MKKLGLCLGGGGARGAYQIGAALALDELGIFDQVQVFSGTSIGSVNACILASLGVQSSKRLWLDFPPDVLKSTENFFKRLIHEKMKLWDNGLYEIKELETLLETHLDLSALMHKEVYITLSEGGNENEGIFGLIKANYHHVIKNDSKAVYVPVRTQKPEDIIKMILASCSIPLVFPPVAIDEKNYYDGGIYDNVPLTPLIEAGCDTIIVIPLMFMDSASRHKHKEITLHPIRRRFGLGGILNFDPKRSERLLELGYEDTIAYFTHNTLSTE